MRKYTYDGWDFVSYTLSIALEFSWWHELLKAGGIYPISS